MKKGKKILCLAFAFVMLFGVIHTSIYANDLEEAKGEDEIIEELQEEEKSEEIEEAEEKEEVSLDDSKEKEEIESNEVSEDVVDEASDTETSIEPKSISTRALVDVSSISDFSDTFDAASNGDELLFTQSFINELLTTTTGVTLTTQPGDSRSIIIDGKNQTLEGSTALGTTLFKLTHNGSGTITFRNMTIKNLPKTAIEISGTGNVTFENVTFDTMKDSSLRNKLTGTLTVDSCNFSNGLGPMLYDETVTTHTLNISNTYFYNSNTNGQYGIGGGIQISSNAVAVIENSTFENNTLATGMGGAIATRHDGANINLTVKNSYFLNNSTTNNVGGAIGIYHLRGGDVQILDSVFEGNKANGNNNLSDGGAIAIKNNNASYTGNITIAGCNFTGNIAADNGGAMLIEATNDGVTVANVYNNTFVQNSANAVGSPTAVGGAIQTYGAPTSTISHNTFYQNKNATMFGGGAIGISGATNAVNSAKVANNIFVDNTSTGASSTQQNVATKVTVTANVGNNGNVGYDNGQKFIPDNDARNALVVLENIFVDFYKDGDAMPSYASVGDAKPITFGSAGAVGHTQVNSAYIPSPRIDEMLRTNDPRTVTGVLEDVRGYPRESLTPENPYYPNAGSVEIYWTKFDPGTGAWSSRFNVETEGGIESLAYPGQFYKINNPPTFTPSGDPIYDVNKTFTRNTLTGPTDYGFVGWQNDKLTSDLKDVNADYTCRKQTYVAQWRLDEFHLDFDLMGGSPKENCDNHFITQIILKNVNGNLGTVPASEPQKDGFVFDGWYEDDTFAGSEWNFDTDTVTKDVTLYAKWRAEETYTLDFDMQGHGVQVPQQIVAENKTSIKPADPSETGYAFKGWYTDATFTTEYDFTKVITKNTTVYAKWEVVIQPEKEYYTLSFDMQGYGEQVAAQTVLENTAGTKPADPSVDGYKFEGWYTDTLFIVEYDFTTPLTDDVIVYAKWTKETIDKPSIIPPTPSKPTPPINPSTPTTPQVNKPASPSTGDTTNTIQWFVMMGFALLTIGAYRQYKRNR